MHFRYNNNDFSKRHTQYIFTLHINLSRYIHLSLKYACVCKSRKLKTEHDRIKSSNSVIMVDHNYISEQNTYKA